MAKRESVEGKIFGRLIILERVGSDKRNSLVKCQCSCGEITIKNLYDVKSGHTQSCGCLYKESSKTRALGHTPSNVVNLLGQKFGKLTVTGRSIPISYRHGSALWDCVCDCGNTTKNVESRRLRNGDNKSCGCGTRDDGFKKYQYQKYVESANKREYEFTLTLDEFTLLIQSSCYYCGIEPKRDVSIKRTGKFLVNGIDRVDNTLGYLNENCVSCCTQCNTAKGTLSHEEFLEWIKKVYAHTT